VVLQLTPQTPPSTPRLYDGGTLIAASNTLTFATPGLAPGTYFAQVLVDGALSPLIPASGPPTGPVVTV
jgi:hypothetical protein